MKQDQNCSSCTHQCFVYVIHVLAALSRKFGVKGWQFKSSVFTLCSWLWSIRKESRFCLGVLLQLGARGETCSLERLWMYYNRRSLLFLSCSQCFFWLSTVYALMFKMTKINGFEASFKPMSSIAVSCSSFCLTKQLSDQPKSLKHSLAMCCHCLVFRLFGNIHNSFSNKTTSSSNNFAQCVRACMWMPARPGFFLPYLHAAAKMSLCKC